METKEIKKKDKIVVLIVGNHDSGKTTTIKRFEQIHDEANREIRQCRIGWRKSVQLFLGRLDALLAMIYFIPSSPTEKHTHLSILLNNFLPEMLLMAEQLNGNEYNATIEFLNNNGYHIVEFRINQNANGGTWDQWEDNNMGNILLSRVTEIGNAFRNFIIERIQ